MHRSVSRLRKPSSATRSPLRNFRKSKIRKKGLTSPPFDLELYSLHLYIDVHVIVSRRSLMLVYCKLDVLVISISLIWSPNHENEKKNPSTLAIVFVL